MRFLRAVPALAALLACTGCGYIHFGRLPEAAAPVGDDKLATAYTDLRAEHKILQQELALARKEGDALRAALDGRGGGAGRDLAARLEETTRELATLRASYARLQAERASTPGAAAAAAAGALEEKLAATLRDYTQLQEENARLRADVTRTRDENTALAAQLKTAAAQTAQAQSALAQLNLELLAQKEARVRAEQQTAAARAQLAVVLAKSGDAKPTLTDARETSATGAEVIAAPIRLANAPASDAPPTAELRTKPSRVNQPAAGAGAPPGRKHTVAAGDTLETLAQKYYGDPARWTRLYSANFDQLSGGRPLQAGMVLEIPEN
jgi:nucleoid-associated protein YgaU